jgi:hypothetical protein
MRDAVEEDHRPRDERQVARVHLERTRRAVLVVPPDPRSNGRHIRIRFQEPPLLTLRLGGGVVPRQSARTEGGCVYFILKAHRPVFY